MKKKKGTDSPSAKELAAWLRALRLSHEGDLTPAEIPGFDSYTPAYLSGGAGTFNGDGASQAYGELEHYPKRDQLESI
jgi:hypothetical protein